MAELGSSFLLAFGVLGRDGELTATPARDAFGILPWRLRRVLEHVALHLDQELALRELAGVAGLSVFHFCRQFKQSTGLTPHQYVLWQRIARAQILLAESSLNLAEISLAVGFSSQSHFTNNFHRIAGITPRRWRAFIARSSAQSV